MRLALAAVLLIAFTGFAVAERRVEIAPETRIEHRLLARPSSLVHWQGAWWASTERGGAALFRVSGDDLQEVQVLEVPGASNVAWSALAVDGDHLLICDVGDTRGERRALTVYRVAMTDGALEVSATYTLRFSGARHDIGAAVMRNGALHLFSRGSGASLFRADLEKGELEPVGKLEVHEREIVRDAAWCAVHERVLLLGTARVHVLAADHLAPAHSARVYAGRAVAIGAHEGAAVLLDHRGRVYRAKGIQEGKVDEALPSAPTVRLPLIETEHDPDGTGEAWREHAAEIPLPGLADDEYMRWCLAGGYLLVAGRLRYQGAFTSSSGRGQRRGSAVILAVAREREDYRSGDDAVYWFGDNGISGVDTWRVGAPGLELGFARGVAAAGAVEAGVFTFEYSIPITEVFGEGALPERFTVNLLTFSLRDRDPCLAGAGIEVLELPFAWATAELVR
jgi:hypothetical protein